MINDLILNSTYRISDPLHKNLENEKVSFTPVESERNKKITRHDSNNPNYSNRAQISQSIELKQARFLIVESEKELQSLFKAYLDLIGAESEIADNGNRALTTFLQSKSDGKKYDVVVIDTHLKGKKGLDVAKKIRQTDNSQKIVLVTTSMKEELPKEELQSAAIDEKDILVMPFTLSRLSKMVIQQ